MKIAMKRLCSLLLVAFLFSLLCTGCAKLPGNESAPVSSPSASPSLSLESEAPTPIDNPPLPDDGENENTVYVPSFEVYPNSMAPANARSAVMRTDGIWFLRMVQSGEEIQTQLMHGGENASDPVLIASFSGDIYVDHVFPSEDGTVWVNAMDQNSWEMALWEIDIGTGKTLRELPFTADYGTFAGFFDLPDGRVGISVMQPSGTQAILALQPDGSFSNVDAPVNEEMKYLLDVTFLGSSGSGLPEGECLAYDRKCLFAFTPGSKEKRELLKWRDIGVSSANLSPLGMQNGVIRLMDYRYGEYVSLTPTPASQVPVREEIILSCLNLEPSLDEAVQIFNRRNQEYYITIKDYSNGQILTREAQERSVTAMNLDIISGNMPDILCVQEGIPYQSYAEKGLLRDLNPWLEEEGIELLPALKRAGTVDNKLLIACGYFSLQTATGSHDWLGDITGWTVREAENLASSLPDCQGVFTPIMTRDAFMVYLSFYLGGYLDWDSSTASFDSQEFQDVLEFANELSTQTPSVSSFDDAAVMEGKALVTSYIISSINDYLVRDLVYMGKMVCPGFPAGDRVGTLICMETPIAVSAASACQEGARAFLLSILDVQNQTAYTNAFPSTWAAFEKQLTENMREPASEEGYKKIYIMTNGAQFRDPTIYLWDGPEEERLPRTILYWMDDNGSIIREEKMYAMSEAQRDSLLSLVDRAERSRSYDLVIASIVNEESAALFAGQRDTAEVCTRIQKRVEIYLKEQK
jgi:ABC-type glycerol-3-phosphate transport system substrate-binding protein